MERETLTIHPAPPWSGEAPPPTPSPSPESRFLEFPGRAARGRSRGRQGGSTGRLRAPSRTPAHVHNGSYTAAFVSGAKKFDWSAKQERRRGAGGDVPSPRFLSRCRERARVCVCVGGG
ncbi:MAG: hypothetical protein BJ554DRAFT_3907 [Olpidium bornovanus]|uniref:Uncharacterized protein n=1 Tax=Olpidium bornovanus TaxID=278681 RepID=A0A8H7ZMZ2_9FUNG|nr:MAG: hypothetical protein BJ554DRAFT_3907 [Olpidium bornovanus]